MRVGIIGLGYVGLPLAVAFAERGHAVVGLDASSEVVAALADGESRDRGHPVRDASPRLGDSLAATTDPADLAGCDAILICVPTPLANQREPDLSHVRAAAEAIAGALCARASSSSSSRRPTRARPASVLLPILEESGLRAGSDFHLAFSPERIDPGRTDHTLRTTPKVVGGLTEACRARAVEVYERGLRRGRPGLDPRGRRAGEAAREHLPLGQHRARQRAGRALRPDGDRHLGGRSTPRRTKPFGFMRFEPGPGMGGHCLPVDPFYLAFKAREYDFPTEFVELAGKVNQHQPHFCVRQDRARPQRRRQAGPRLAACWCSASPTRPGSATCASRRR